MGTRNDDSEGERVFYCTRSQTESSVREGMSQESEGIVFEHGVSGHLMSVDGLYELTGLYGMSEKGGLQEGMRERRENGKRKRQR